MDKVRNRLELFQEILESTSQLCYWEFDSKWQINYISNPGMKKLTSLILKEEWKKKANEYMLINDKPALITTYFSLTFVLDFYVNEEQEHFPVILGPVFISDFSLDTLKVELLNMEYTFAERDEILSTISLIPILSIVNLIQFGTMLHCCLKKGKIGSGDFQFFESEHLFENPKKNNNHFFNTEHENEMSYAYEQKLLKMVEQGNLEYIETRKNRTAYVKVGTFSDNDSLRQIKNLCISLICLCSRAAIKGGLSPTEAYRCSDFFIQAVERCKTNDEVLQIIQSTQEDFIRKVHRKKMANYSFYLTKKCCDYIQVHIEEDISINKLAKYTSYSPSYLGKRFKKDIGISIREYINQEKVNHAKVLLKTKNYSISTICEVLKYSSVSYFVKVFRESVGIPPAEYREQFSR